MNNRIHILAWALFSLLGLSISNNASAIESNSSPVEIVEHLKASYFTNYDTVKLTAKIQVGASSEYNIVKSSPEEELSR